MYYNTYDYTRTYLLIRKLIIILKLRSRIHKIKIHNFYINYKINIIKINPEMTFSQVYILISHPEVIIW